MPLITTSVPNLVQGVSQQPDNLRYPGQAEEQVNAFSSVVDGLNKRPHTEHVANLNKTFQDDALIHMVERDETNKHLFTFDNVGGTTSVSIFNVSLGTPVPVVSISASAQTYLNSAVEPLKDLRALTIADYTFVANKKVTPALGTTLSDPLEKEALVFVKQGDYRKDYTVNIDNLQASFRSGASSSASNADSKLIASNIESAINNAGTAGGVGSVTISNGGSGWYTHPDINPGENPSEVQFKTEVTFTGGGGSGAKGKAITSNGVIQSVVITHSGSGYTSAPTPVFKLYIKISLGSGFGPWFLMTNQPTDAPTVSAVTLSTASINVTNQDGLLKISKSDNTDFKISVTDGLANTGLGLVYKEVDFITDLPKKCFDGFRVKVRGDVELTQDDYYVEFETKDNEEFGEGAWTEVAGWSQDGSASGQTEGEALDFDASTMPIQIVPEPLVNGVVTGYKIKTSDWTHRRAGDLETNPAPSFVGSPINDVFFFKNRLGFLTDNAVIFSEADEYFNFWRTTTQSLLDSAPIDVGVAHTKVSTLKYATPFQEKLVLFSPQSQFVLRGADLLTPKTVNISPITEYNVSTDVKPLALTNYVYFSFPRDSYEGMYEFYVDKDSDVFDASEITQQVPTYVRSSLRTLVGTPSEDVIVASTSDDLKHLYVYKYFWNNKEKIQSSWMRFEFAKEVVGTGFIDSNLYIVTKEGYLEKMAMEAGHKDTGKTYTLHLDRRVSSASLTRSYSAGNKRTTISNMPYDPVGSVVYTADGLRREITRVDATSFTLVGDYSATDFFVGLEYEALYQFSTQTLKQPTERGGRSASNFMSQVLRNGTIDYADTGHFTVEVTPEFRDTYTYAFNPTQLGANSVLGSLVLDNGSFRFPVHSKHDDVTITVKSSSALPMKLLAAEFESFVHGRSKRYGG
jgi:hypothetical protein